MDAVVVWMLSSLDGVSLHVDTVDSDTQDSVMAMLEVNAGGKALVAYSDNEEEGAEDEEGDAHDQEDDDGDSAAGSSSGDWKLDSLGFCLVA